MVVQMSQTREKDEMSLACSGVLYYPAVIGLRVTLNYHTGSLSGHLWARPDTLYMIVQVRDLYNSPHCLCPVTYQKI